MPALYLQGKLASLPVIISSFVIESFVIVFILKTKWKTGIFYSILSNIMSLIVGIPFRSFIVIMMGSMVGTVYRSVSELEMYIHLLFLVMFITIINTCIEFAVLVTFSYCCMSKKLKDDEKNSEFINKSIATSLLIALLVGNFITAAMAIFFVK